MVDTGCAAACSLLGCKSLYSGKGDKCGTACNCYACFGEPICGVHIRMGKEVREDVEGWNEIEHLNGSVRL